MTILSRVRTFLRRALGAPFRLEPRDRPAGVMFELIATHEARLRSRSITGDGEAVAKLRAIQWDLRDFAATVRGPVLLDTGLGWVIRGRSVLVVGNWSLIAQSQVPKPSMLRWAKALIDAEDIDCAVWLPFGSGNYFHLFNDFVAGLALLVERRDLTSCVVLVSEDLAGKGYFKEVMALSTLLSRLDLRTYRNDRWLRVGEVHVAGTSYGSYATFRRAIALLDLLPPVATKPERRLFISRSPHAPRTPSNIEALERSLMERGFEVIEFEGMSVVQQREVINSASTIVGVHGAGLANLAFHETPAGVKLAEITPADFLNPCFAFLAEEAGMEYFCFVGGPRDPGAGNRFHVPLDAFLEALEVFLAR